MAFLPPEFDACLSFACRPGSVTPCMGANRYLTDREDRIAFIYLFIFIRKTQQEGENFILKNLVARADPNQGAENDHQRFPSQSIGLVTRSRR